MRNVCVSISNREESLFCFPPILPSTCNLFSASNKLMAGKGINFLKGILPGSLVPKYFESEWSFAQVHRRRSSPQAPHLALQYLSTSRIGRSQAQLPLWIDHSLECR